MNKKLIAFAALVFAVVLTSFSVSGTYAKYTSVALEGTDKAKVAKWVFDKTSSIDVFKNTYAATDAEGGELAINGGSKVIAPGASGNIDVVLTGETETNFTIKVDSATATGFLADGTFETGYKPIRFSLDGSNWVDIDGLKGLLQTAVETGKVYPAGKYGSASGDNEVKFTLQWHWVFDEDSKTTENDAKATPDDGKDTTAGSTKYNETADNTFKLTLKLSTVQSNKKATETPGKVS